LDKKSNKWYKFNNLPENHGLYDVIIKDKSLIFTIRQGRQSSIAQYDIDTKQFHVILKMNTNGVLKKYDNYLIFCSDDGIFFSNLITKKTKILTTANGLVSNLVNDVYFEGQDMWVLTQEGISKAKIADVLKVLEETN
jgi:hypothetical protein